MNETLVAALGYHAAGLCVIPTRQPDPAAASVAPRPDVLAILDRLARIGRLQLAVTTAQAGIDPRQSAEAAASRPTILALADGTPIKQAERQAGPKAKGRVHPPTTPAAEGGG